MNFFFFKGTILDPTSDADYKYSVCTKLSSRTFPARDTWPGDASDTAAGRGIRQRTKILERALLRTKNPKQVHQQRFES